MKSNMDNLGLILLGILSIVGIILLIYLASVSNTGNLVEMTPSEACNRIPNKCKGPGYFVGVYENFAMCICHRDVTHFEKGIPKIYNPDKIHYISLTRKY